MKKFLTVVGLLTVIATPAFAQSYSHDFGTGNVINEPALEQQAGRADAMSAFAQAPAENTRSKAVCRFRQPSRNRRRQHRLQRGTEAVLITVEDSASGRALARLPRLLELSSYFGERRLGRCSASQQSGLRTRNKSHGKSSSGSPPCASFDRRCDWWRADFGLCVRAVSRLPKRQSRPQTGCKLAWRTSRTLTINSVKTWTKFNQCRSSHLRVHHDGLRANLH